jgi:hypothetical protein
MGLIGLMSRRGESVVGHRRSDAGRDAFRGVRLFGRDAVGAYIKYFLTTRSAAPFFVSYSFKKSGTFSNPNRTVSA